MVKKRVISIALVCAMILGNAAAPTNAVLFRENFGQITVSAKEFENGDFTFDTYDNKIIITGYTGKASKITLPSKVDGLTISSVCMYNGLPDTVTSVVIPEGYLEIQSSCFSGAKNLSNITIPKSVTFIGRDAFGGTAWLKNKEKKNPLVVVNGSLITAHTSKGKVVIPNSIEKIVNGAFAGNKNITSVVLNNNIKDIPDMCFTDCTKLKSIVLPSKLQTVGYESFYGCESLQAIEFPSTVTRISEMSFVCCKSLKYVTIPAKVEWFGGSTFGSCTELKSITFLNKDIEFRNSDYTDFGNITVYGLKDSTAEKFFKNRGNVTFAVVKSLKSATVTLSESSFKYDGKSKTPTVTVKVGNITLVKGKDYSVKYSNNKNAGTATVTITGVGEYAGAVKQTFTIKK